MTSSLVRRALGASALSVLLAALPVAASDAEAIVSRAREEIALERDQAIEQIRREFADIAITAAERVIEQSLDRSAHQRLIDQVLAESQLGQRS